MIDLGIVIVNYNVAGLLEACLNSVFESVGLTFDVIVIDNASTDESVAMMREKFPHVTLGVSPQNIGFGAANNVGLRKFLARPEAEVDSVVGAFMILPTRVVRKVGLLDEDFFMYGEDLDWAFRIKEAGYKVRYNPTVRVLHVKGASSRQNSLRATFEFYRAMLIFYRKHYAAGTFFLWRWLMPAAISIFGVFAYLRNYLRPAPSRRVS